MPAAGSASGCCTANDAMELLSIIGHLSFAMTAVSFMITRMLMRRVLAILSLSLGIVYNGLIAMGWPNGQPTPELWNAVGWLSLFLTINLFQTARLVLTKKQAQAVRLPARN